jgi:hypothetical protein
MNEYCDVLFKKVEFVTVLSSVSLLRKEILYLFPIAMSPQSKASMNLLTGSGTWQINNMRSEMSGKWGEERKMFLKIRSLSPFEPDMTLSLPILIVSSSKKS